MRRPIHVVLWIFALGAHGVHAYEGAVHVEQIDAGVHLPVLTRPPQLEHFVEAIYPAEAAQQQLSGDVKLLLAVAADGSVSEARVTEGAGHGFDEAALAAVRQFHFVPAEVDGVPAPIRIEYVYHFALSLPDAGVADAGPPAPPRATLKGEVIARGSRKRVLAATVRCSDVPDAPEATTDERGRFELRVPAGECLAKVFADGFNLYQTREVLQPNTTTEVVFYLLPKAIGYETVVRGERDKKEVVRRTLDREELQKVPGSFGDPIRVIQDLPGVARPPFDTGQLIVRGASPNQTATLLDGVRIPILFHLGGGPSVVNSEFLDRIDFYPGGFGSRYGRAIGGIVDVTTRKGSTDTLHGSGKIDLLDTGVFAESPVVDGVSVAAAARRSYIDTLLPTALSLFEPQLNSGGGTLLILPRYWDYQARIDVGTRRNPAPGTATNNFYLMAFGSDDSLRVAQTGNGLDRPLNFSYFTLFHRLKGDWTYRQGKLNSVFAPYLGYDTGGGGVQGAVFKTESYSAGGREDLTLELSRFVTARAGFDLFFSHLYGSANLPVLNGVQIVAFPGGDPLTPTQTVTRNINSFDGALFAEADLKAGPLTITPGLRATYARVHGHDLSALEPRLWARWQLAPTTALKGSVGLYTQPPTAVDLEPAPLGNSDLVREKAFQTSLGVEHRFSDVVNVDVTGFYNRRFDLIVNPAITIPNPGHDLYTNNGLGRAYGIEVLARHEVTRNLFGWLAYTLSRSETRQSQTTGDYRLDTYDQTHILTFVGSYRLPLGFEVGARFRYVTGRPTTDIVHPYDVYNVDGNNFSGTPGAPLGDRLRAFQQLDVRIDKTWLFQSWTLGVYLDVQNVYNAKNVETIVFDYRFRESFEIAGVPILPVLGVKGSF